MNLTLCRKLSVQDVVVSMSHLDPVKRQAVLESFDQCMQYFFSSKTTHESKMLDGYHITMIGSIRHFLSLKKFPVLHNVVYYHSSNTLITIKGDEKVTVRRSVPRALRVASILQSAEDDVAIVTFYTKGGFDFFL